MHYPAFASSGQTDLGRSRGIVADPSKTRAPRRALPLATDIRPAVKGDHTGETASPADLQQGYRWQRLLTQM